MTDAPRQATRLDAIEGRFDPWLLGAAIALACLGVVMVASSSIAIGEGLDVGPFYFLTRHLVFLAGGCGLALWMMRTELKTIESHNQLLLLACFVLLLAVFLPGIGRTVNGARRWLNLGVSNFQAVEAVKLLYIVWLASYLVRFRDEVNATWKAMLKPLGVAIALVGLPILAAIAIAEPYRVRRFTSFLNPWADPFDSGYQLTNALMAVGRGEVFGVGLGASVQKLSYLPEAHTDFILAVIAEELGLVGVALVIGLYALLAGRAFWVGLKCVEMRRHFAGYCAFGVALWMSLQSFVSIGVNLGLLPTKGLTLPLISSGGSSVLMTCMAIGLLLRVSYELDRAERQVARLRGEAQQPAPGNVPATAQPVAAAAASKVRGTSRLRQRVEPTLGRLA
jgi:cell division protein FtsW